MASDFSLSWLSGETELSFPEARRCALVITAAPGTTLPVGWQLQWTADADSVGAPLAFVPDASPAGACEILTPANAAELAARAVTAHFCEGSASTVTEARLVTDAPAGIRASLQAVGFVATGTDSMAGNVVRSNVITANGGAPGSFPPLVLKARSTHRLGELTVDMVGANLERVSDVPIAAMDASWTYSLPVVSRSSGALRAQANIAAPLPEIVVGAADEGGALGATTLAADSFPPFEPQMCVSEFEGSLDTTLMQPKDFAMVVAGDTWHLFYTRQHAAPGIPPNANQRSLGHAKSTSPTLDTWSVVDRAAIEARPGRIWDNLHVWAPTVIRQGLTYYMFYTGVQLDTISLTPLVTSEIQRIGLATSIDLDNWTQEPEPLLWNKKVPWTFQDSTRHGSPIARDSWQFRDPFVMPDPDSLGEYLMYFTTIDSEFVKYVIGVARTDQRDLRKWKSLPPFRRTSAELMNADRNESPHAFRFHGKWWLLYTSNHPNQDEITHVWSFGSPADSAGWTQPDSLKAITCGQDGFNSTLSLWHATEYEWLSEDQQYLAAFTDNLAAGGKIAISKIEMPDNTCPTDTLRLGCVTWTLVDAGAEPRGEHRSLLRLEPASRLPSHGATTFDLDLRQESWVHVAIYDVSGRRLRTLVNGPRPAGRGSIRWDGALDSGRPLGSGVYFARAATRDRQAVVTVPLVR